MAVDPEEALKAFEGKMATDAHRCTRIKRKIWF
jgi:hypothetical protein